MEEVSEFLMGGDYIVVIAGWSTLIPCHGLVRNLKNLNVFVVFVGLGERFIDNFSKDKLVLSYALHMQLLLRCLKSILKHIRGWRKEGRKVTFLGIKTNFHVLNIAKVEIFRKQIIFQFISKINNTHVKKPQANKMDKYSLQFLISS